MARLLRQHNLININININTSIIYGLMNIKYFDVTLRDGLQSISNCYSFEEKKSLLNTIVSKANPDSIEIGSIVSPKILPQMSDSLKLYKYAIEKYNCPKFYMLIPNENAMKIADTHKINNISLVTSISDAFQKKNVNKSLVESKEEIKKILTMYDLNNVKLYISCINRCPITGIQDTSKIIEELMYYVNFNKITEFCISDTCGDLDYNTFYYLINIIKKIIDVDKISLHLHVSKSNVENTKKIIKYALSLKIIKYDVSYVKNIGGCSVTMNDIINPNLTYEILNDCINDGINI
tara:strand:- start:7708 stop:8589 length:882 start_codon:yes stop_codon:yes gene_type:complete